MRTSSCLTRRRGRSSRRPSTDRTGQISILLLALAGVQPTDIVDDYMLSHERLRVRYRSRGEVDQAVEIEAYLAGRGTSARDVVLATLASLDVEAVLLGAGLEQGQIEAVRARLLGPRQA